MKIPLSGFAMAGLIVSALAPSPAQSHGLSWSSARGGHVPDGAVIAGREADGQVLFICRAKYKGGVHPGKIRSEFKGCNIPWGGREQAISQYEVLTY